VPNLDVYQERTQYTKHQKKKEWEFKLYWSQLASDFRDWAMNNKLKVWN